MAWCRGMEGWQGWTLLSGGALFALLAVGAGITGDWPLTPLFGGFAVALIAGGLLSYRQSTPLRAATRKGSVRIEGTQVPSVEVPYSTMKSLIAVVGLVGMTAAGVGIALSGRPALGVALGGLFVLGALLAARNLVLPPALAITERGLHVNAGGWNKWAPWEDVERVYLDSVNGAGFLRIVSTHPARVEGPAWFRVITRLTWRWGALSVPVDALPVDAKRLVRAITDLVEDPTARRDIAARGLAR